MSRKAEAALSRGNPFNNNATIYLIIMADKSKNIDGLLDVKGAAQYLMLSENYVYQLKHKGKIPYHNSDYGRKLYFVKEELFDWATAIRFKSNDELKEEAARYVLNSKKHR